MLIPLAVVLLATPAAADTFSYGCSKQKKVTEINLTTHTARVAGTLKFGTNACDWDPTAGRLYYWEQQSQGANAFAYWVPGGSNGTNKVVASALPMTIIKQMAFAPNGTLYAVSFDYYLYVINKATGIPTLQGQITGLEPVLPEVGQITGDLIFDDDGGCWLVTNQSVYTLDPATRVASIVHGPGMLDPDGPGPLQPEQTVWTGLSWQAETGQPIVSERSFSSLGSIRAIDPVSGTVDQLLVMSAGANDLSQTFVR